MFKFNGQVYKLVNGKKEDITSKVCKAVKRFATKFLKQNQMEDLFIDERIETYLIIELGKKIKKFFSELNIIVSQGWEIIGDFCNLTNNDLFDIEGEAVNEEAAEDIAKGKEVMENIVTEFAEAHGITPNLVFSILNEYFFDERSITKEKIRVCLSSMQLPLLKQIMLINAILTFIKNMYYKFAAGRV